MAKKRKVSARAVEQDPSMGWNDQGGKLNAINSYEDVADSEDEFHINRDKIMLDDGPDTKRRRKWQEDDALLEPSDEEILGYYSGEDKEASDDEAPNASDEEAQEDGDEDIEGWGSSKRDYYNNDNIETEADALEEEQEARRLQQKRLEKMTEADFGLDELKWLATSDTKDEESGAIVTEVLRDIKIDSEMGPKERLNILQSRYPELGTLANELIELRPQLDDLKRQVASQPAELAQGEATATLVKARALAAYVASLAMYFAILSSPAIESEALPLDPLELRDHAVMDSLFRCRELWKKVKSLKAQISASQDPVVKSKQGKDNIVGVDESKSTDDKDQPMPNKEKQKSKRQVAIEAATASVADLSTLIPKRTKKALKSAAVNSENDDDSDFGEETSLNAHDAAVKATRRKNLNFYTSQIAQKSNKRGEKSREAGGDMDLPHKERLRDRQARLNAEAEARGKQLDSYGRGGKGVSLDQEGESEEDETVAREVRDDEDEYYDMISKNSKERKRANEDHRSAIRQAKEQNSLLRVVEGDMDEEGKRAIGYVIEKNKGLAPKRKKDVRNPRVKKRKKFEEKKKKLNSMRAVYKGGEERGGYGGEKTGIKTGLVKSIKL